MLNSALELLQASIVGQTVRSAGYLYAALETFHVLGIGLLIGSIFAIDLRLLGVGRKAVSVTSAMRHLLPVSYVGFITASVTGVALLSAQATMIAASGPMPVTPDAIWAKERLSTEIALEHDFYPDGWELAG